MPTDTFCFLTIPKDVVTQSIIYRLKKKYNLVPNIFRAEVTEDEAWVDLGISGTSLEVDKATDFLKNRNITVNAIEGDIIE